MADNESLDDERRYKAPALEKGLDILELLATVSSPMTLTGIVNELGRSHGELFRMIQVLEYRGYIEQERGAEGYLLSDKLFSLGIQRPKTHSLIEVALPVMRQLAQDVAQSCHLAFHSRGEIVVAARMESSEQVGFSVRVGYRRALVKAASGAVLYAFQPDDVRARWEQFFDPQLSETELAAWRVHADEIREQRVALNPSRFVPGVTDISAPIMRGGVAAAALTVPFLETLGRQLPKEDVAARLLDAATQISDQLIESDSRV